MNWDLFGLKMDEEFRLTALSHLEFRVPEQLSVMGIVSKSFITTPKDGPKKHTLTFTIKGNDVKV